MASKENHVSLIQFDLGVIMPTYQQNISYQSAAGLCKTHLRVKFHEALPRELRDVDASATLGGSELASSAGDGHFIDTCMI